MATKQDNKGTNITRNSIKHRISSNSLVQLSTPLASQMKFVFDDKISCMSSDREISQMNKEAITSGGSLLEQ